MTKQITLDGKLEAQITLDPDFSGKLERYLVEHPERWIGRCRCAEPVLVNRDGIPVEHRK